MKTTIKTDAQGYVTISYDDADSGERITTTYFCPLNGGYVRIRDAAQRYPQVCERLSGSGSTLMCSSREKLAEVVRREYRAMRRAEKREAARYL